MNAIIATIATLLSLIFQQCYIARAKGPVTYIVGDDLGWTLDGYPESWTGGKKFYAGDILGMSSGGALMGQKGAIAPLFFLLKY
jgi:hypothetical protein